MGTRVFDLDITDKTFDITRKSTQTAKKRMTIWVDEGKVTMSESDYLTGIKHGKGKRWWRWRTVGACGFIRTKNGLAQPFQIRRPDPLRGNGWTNVVPSKPVNFLTGSGDSLGDEFQYHMWKQFGLNSFDELYPMAKEFGVTKFNGMPLGIRKAFRAGSMDEFVTTIFGKSRVTDHLTAAVAASDPYFINLAAQYRGFVPTPQLTNYLRRQRMSEGIVKHLDDVTQWGNASYATSPDLRTSFRFTNDVTIRNLFEIPVDAFAASMISSISMANGAARSRKRRAIGLNIHGSKLASDEIKDWKVYRNNHMW